MNDPLLDGFDMDGEYVHWPRRLTIMTACALFLFATMGVTLIRLISALGMVIPALRSAQLSQVLSLLVTLGVMGVPVLVYNSRHPGVDATLRLRLPSTLAVAIAIALGVLGAPISSHLGTLWSTALQQMGARVELAQTAVPTNYITLIGAMFSMALVPAVCEELLFRGAILGAWERRGTKRAWVLSSVLFALIHGSLLGLPGQLLMGFAIGYLVINSDSILTGMIYHFVHNVTLILMSMVPQMQLDASLSGDIYHAIGGAAGVTLYVIRLLLMLGAFALLLVAASSEREKLGRPFERPGQLDREPLGWREITVLSAGIVTCLALLLINILTTLRIM
ncbi:CPBP family intramembrane metalloprotease [Eubacteriales bacterium OttesenSCG-928-N13]|nr:CPBP family intramembrane metalloprotease [Eubacteriales bacterium OttesenSCG-928-N13]